MNMTDSLCVISTAQTDMESNDTGYFWVFERESPVTASNGSHIPSLISIKLNYSTCSSKEKFLKALFTIHFIRIITDGLHKHFRSGNSSTGTKM